MFADIHCHLDLITEDHSSIDEIIKVCQKEQFNYLFNISVNKKSNFSNQILAQKHKMVYFTVGIHPSEADNFSLEDIVNIEPFLTDNKCVGIGEIGLDFFRQYSSKENQRKVFLAFLDLAVKYNKPVIIHSREALVDIIQILQQPVYQKLRGIFHCFSYGYKEAKQCIDLGFKISFAGNITYKNAKDIQDAAVQVPLTDVFLETDAPYLAPVPYRGKTNYPYYVKVIYEFFAGLKKIPVERVEEVLEQNIRNFFRI